MVTNNFRKLLVMGHFESIVEFLSKDANIRGARSLAMKIGNHLKAEGTPEEVEGFPGVGTKTAQKIMAAATELELRVMVIEEERAAAEAKAAAKLAEERAQADAEDADALRVELRKVLAKLRQANPKDCLALIDSLPEWIEACPVSPELFLRVRDEEEFLEAVGAIELKARAELEKAEKAAAAAAAKAAEAEARAQARAEAEARREARVAAEELAFRRLAESGHLQAIRQVLAGSVPAGAKLLHRLGYAQNVGEMSRRLAGARRPSGWTPGVVQILADVLEVPPADVRHVFRASQEKIGLRYRLDFSQVKVTKPKPKKRKKRPQGPKTREGREFLKLCNQMGISLAGL